MKRIRGAVLGALFATAGFAGQAFADEGAKVREVEIVVDQGRYQPNKIEVSEGERVRITFLRKEYSACTKEVVFPSLGIKRELPTNKPVVIELDDLKPGEVPFRCGMKMTKGVLQVDPK